MSQSIRDLLTTAKHKHLSHSERDLSNVTKSFKSLTPKLEMTSGPAGVLRELVCLNGTIPVTFSGASYNIPIGIFISDNHPYDAPICFVRPTNNMTIKTSRHVDVSGKVFLPYLSQWNEDTSDILGLVREMQVAFGQMCPVFRKVWSGRLMVANVTRYLTRTQSSSSKSTAASTQTSTITHECINPKLSSAVEGRLKQRVKTEVKGIHEEIAELEKVLIQLNKRKDRLDILKTQLAREVTNLNDAKAKLQDLSEHLRKFIDKYD